MALNPPGSLLIVVPKDLHPSHSSSSDTVGFKPMYFGRADRSIFQVDLGTAFQLSPVPSTILLSREGQDTNATPHADCFDVGNLADDLKVHQFQLSHPLRSSASRQPFWKGRPPAFHGSAKLLAQASRHTYSIDSFMKLRIPIPRRNANQLYSGRRTAT
jgi:hypothetical protein